jgi:hypothetical protein
MHVTIETSHRADPTSKIEMLRLGQPSIIITVSVDPEQEPNSSLIILAEKLVNLDKVRLIQNMSTNGVVNANQTIYLNSFEDSGNLQWVECTAARSAKKQGEPLFLVKNPVVYTNTSVYYEKNTGRSYLRIDMSQSIYKRSIEVAKIQFNTCQRDQTLGKHPIYRFVFYQYQNNRLVREPKELIPPFVFGTINHGQNVKAIEGYRNMLARINVPALQQILKEPDDNSGVSNDALANGSQDAIIIAARSMANHVISSTGSDALDRKLTQKERIRMCLNGISMSDQYKPMPIPEYLPPRPAPTDSAQASTNAPTSPPGQADAMGMMPVPDAIVGHKKREKNGSPNGTSNQPNQSVFTTMAESGGHDMRQFTNTFFKKTPSTGIMSVLPPTAPPKQMFHGSVAQPFLMMNQRMPSYYPQTPYEQFSSISGVKPLPPKPTAPNVFRPQVNRSTITTNVVPRAPMHKGEPVSVASKRTAFLATTSPVTIVNDDDGDEAVQPPSPKFNRPPSPSFVPYTKKSPDMKDDDDHEDPTMPPEDDEEMFDHDTNMSEDDSMVFTLTKLMNQEHVIEESDDEDKAGSGDENDMMGAGVLDNLKGKAIEEISEEDGYDSPEPFDPNDGEYKERKRSVSSTPREPKGKSRDTSGKGLVFKCTVCNKKKTDKQGDIKRQVTRSNVYLYQLVFKRTITCGRVCQECLNEYNHAPCKLCGSNDFRTGTLSLKSDLIPKYEAAFGRQNLQEGKLCRACYGKFYAYTNKSGNTTVGNKRSLDGSAPMLPISPPVKRVKSTI